MKRDHKSKPAPRTSPVMDSRSPVAAHDGTKSVGTHKSRKKIAHANETTDPANGRELDGGSAPPVATSRNNGQDVGGQGQPSGGARAPGSLGVPLSGPNGLSSW